MHILSLVIIEKKKIFSWTIFINYFVDVINASFVWDIYLQKPSSYSITSGNLV